MKKHPTMKLIDYGYFEKDPKFPLDDITWF